MRWLPLFVIACSSNHAAPPDTATIGDGSGSIDAPPGSGLSIVSQFDGAAGPGYKDHPDLGGAVGPSHVVDMVGSAFVVHDKATGAVVQNLTQAQFWTAAGITPGKLNDPRVMFDPLVNRWYAATAAPADVLAISVDADPTHAWKAITLDPTLQGDLTPRIGFDANGVYVCSYGGNLDAICFALPKADVLWTGSGAPSQAHQATFTNQTWELTPVVDTDPAKPATAPECLLTRIGPQAGTNMPIQLALAKVTWSGTTATISPTQTISTSLTYTMPVSAVQPSAPLIRGVEDHRTWTTVQANGNLYTAVGSELGSRIGFHWFEVRVSDGAVLQSGTLADPSYDAMFPTVAIDGNGSLGIGFTKTSASEFPSVYVTGRLATDAPGTLRPPVLATAGTATYSCTMTPVGWGTYSSTVVDPSAPGTMWTYQEYGASATACAWTTRWVAFQIR